MFRDRVDAGKQLAAQLEGYRGKNAVVLGLPRGGVPVAYEVARALDLPLDVLVVRKIGAPVQPELGIGAVAEGGVRYVDHRIAAEVGADDDEIDAIAAREMKEVERRVQRWRGARPRKPLTGKIAIVVDDGIATGGTVRAALRALRMFRPDKIVLAVPVAPASTLPALEEEADEVVCVEPADMLWAIGAWYEDFQQVPDDVVSALLDKAHAGHPSDDDRSPVP